MRLTHRIGLKTLKTKLQCSPCEPTKAHITAKEFVLYFRFLGLLQVLFPLWEMVRAKIQQNLDFDIKMLVNLNCYCK